MRSRFGRPVFSVVLPTYNRAHLLGRSVTSVLTQAFDDFELIVVDDASTDHTREVIRSFRDSRLRYLDLKAHGGAATARNSGILVARGHYLALLDDDDEYLPGFLQSTYSVVRDAPPRIGFLWSGLHRVRTENGVTHVQEKRIWHADSTARHGRIRHLRQAASIGTSYGVTLRMSALRQVGLFDPTLPVAQDTELFLRFIAMRYDFLSIPEPLIRHHDHDGRRLTDAGNHGLRLAATTRIMRRYAELLHEHTGLSAALRQHADDLRSSTATRLAMMPAPHAAGRG